MFEEKLLVGIASLASTIAILTCVVVIPGLYSTINEMHDEVCILILFSNLHFRNNIFPQKMDQKILTKCYLYFCEI